MNGLGFHNDTPQPVHPALKHWVGSESEVPMGGGGVGGETATTSSEGPCQVTEEIEELARSLGYDPYELLVIPEQTKIV